MKIELDLNPEEVDKLANILALKVAEKLKRLFGHQAQDGDGIFTVESLAEYLGVDKSWVYHNIRQIPHFKIGRFPRFRKREVDKWLEQHKAPIFNELQHKFIRR